MKWKFPEWENLCIYEYKEMKHLSTYNKLIKSLNPIVMANELGCRRLTINLDFF